MLIEQGYASRTEAEFLCEAGATLALFEVLIGNLRAREAPPSEGIGLICKDARKLLALASVAGQPLMGLLLRRLDDYLLDLENPGDSHIDDLETFVDVIRGILDAEIPSDIDQAEFVRSLPVRRPLDIEDVEHLDIEILVVDPHRTAARIVERDLVNCGFRVSMAHRSFEALELTVRTQPDMVISSAVLDEMSGVELACALAAIESTGRVPFALLTSFEPCHASLKRLPSEAALIRKGEDFGADLAEALSRFRLT